MTTELNLTEMERIAMSVQNTDYGTLLEGDETWAFAWMDETRIPEKQLRGVMSSLIKKGLLIVVKGRGDDDTLYYTEEGIQVSKSLKKGEETTTTFSPAEELSDAEKGRRVIELSQKLGQVNEEIARLEAEQKRLIAEIHEVAGITQ